MAKLLLRHVCMWKDLLQGITDIEVKHDKR